ncbi:MULTISPECIES: Imm50 family immunity protein [unclassified Streptomyces]|uniref:Imm50 family immunity protein n=1 Tax=unclassified Streptomyces TaxID=2593676 RepID=UPI00381ECD2E
MSESSWSSFLEDPQEIHRFYNQVPELNGCDLFYFLMDERGRGVTLGFETSRMPQHGQYVSEAREFNSFEFYLTFLDVQAFTVEGWSGPARKDVTLVGGAAGKIHVKIESPGSLVAFEADSVSLGKSRFGLVSRKG